MPNSAQRQFLTFCHEQIATFRHAIQQMRDGKMGTHGTRGGQIVDTTAESIARFSAMVEELEQIVAKSGAENA